MTIEPSSAAGIAYSCLQVAGTALLIGGLCWTLREIDGNGRSTANASTEVAAAPSERQAAPAAMAVAVASEYDRGPDLPNLETFKAACERKLKNVVGKLGPAMSAADRASLVQHISHSVETADPHTRRIQRHFRGSDAYEYGCTQSVGQPVLAVVTRSPG